MKSYSINQYLIAGCPEMYGAFLDVHSLTSGAFLEVHSITNGKICDTGCFDYQDGACKAYKNMITGRIATAEPTETVRQEAVRREISIKKVRRERNAKV